jgi:hypothetical protein
MFSQLLRDLSRRAAEAERRVGVGACVLRAADAQSMLHAVGSAVDSRCKLV